MSSISSTTTTTRQKRKAGKAPAASASVSVSIKEHAKPRKPRRAKRQTSNALQLFKRSATNPFQYAPPGLGYDVFSTPNLLTAWNRTYGAQINAGGSFAVLFDPSTIVQTTGAFGAVANSFYKYAVGASSVSLSTLSASTACFGSANAATLQTLSRVFRPITAGIRVSVRYAASSAPGRVMAVSVSDSQTAIGAMSIDQLSELDGVHPISFDGSGVAMIQNNYRQTDAYDFTFSTTAAPQSASVTISQTIIIGLGWPANTSFDIEAVAHLEGFGGTLAGAMGGDEVPSLALSTPIEVLGAQIRKMPYVLNKEAISMCERAQLLSAMKRSPRDPAQAYSSESVQNGIPAGVSETDFVDISSSAGEFVQGLSRGVRDNMPSASRAGMLVGGALFGLAARNAHLPQLRGG